MDQKLFGVYLGGRAEKSNIELHDVVFVVGSSLESTYPLLVKKWLGFPHKDHIDSYVELDHVDGFEIHVLPAIGILQEEQLFFNN